MAKMTSYEQLKNRETAIAVVGLGYVGLPLAVALDRKFDVLGFDVSEDRIAQLESGFDRTGEVADADLKDCKVGFTSDPADLTRCGVVLVAVPTPIDVHRSPDLRPVIGASGTVGRNLSPGTVVVYESTVYPGLTEEVCVPILERESGLACGRDFWVGYSPERINPGDREHTLKTIVKVVAGQTKECTDLLADIYGAVVEAGVHRAPSIKVAEAAKVIENTQRDLNIALMNELAMIFDRMGIDTLDVLEAAATKWNFLPFRPGLVGGHCIGVDPYYLTFKAESLGFHPNVILAGRGTNDSVGQYVALSMVKRMTTSGLMVKDARIGVLGLTFKENVPDLRNTKVVDLLKELEEYGMKPLVSDAAADPEEAMEEYGIRLRSLDELRDIEALVLAVGHKEYADLDLREIRLWFRNPEKALIFDIKGFFSRKELDKAGFSYWRL